jgi:uncharacterized integral membrane protein (TIGR00698 family)
LKKNLLGVRVDQIPRLLPGLILAALLAWLSMWLSRFVGEEVFRFERTPVSPVMMAILLGLLIGNLVRLPSWLNPGLNFSVTKVLRLGIILLGIRLSLFAVFSLGLLGIPIVVLCILGALLVTTSINARLNLPRRLGVLIAVGTSICGVSAIVATAPVVDADDEEVAYAVAVITVFGIIATLFYPYLANWMFEGDAVKAGLFLGTSIHDTSQVTGAALVYADVFSQPRALDVATVTKLVRNVFMVAVIPLMALSYAKRNAADAPVGNQDIKLGSLIPLFVFGFLFVAAVRSVGDAGIETGGKAFGIWDSVTWNAIVNWIRTSAIALLVVALAAVGLTTRFRSFQVLGAKPFFVGLGAALSVGAISIIAITLLGSFIKI